MTIDDLLIRARKMGASDVHVTVGIPPKCRVNGELVTLMEGRILPADSCRIFAFIIKGKPPLETATVPARRQALHKYSV